MKNEESGTFETEVALAEAAEIIRKIGEDLAEGKLLLGQIAYEAGQVKNLKIGLKQGKGQDRTVSLKIKVKLATAQPPQPESPAGETPAPARPAKSPKAPKAAEPSGDGRPPYKKLKDRMKGSFKQIKTSLTAGIMPPGDALAAFIADSSLMVSYPGYGDPMYPAYTAAVTALATAAGNGDTAAAASAVTELETLRKQCHKQFK